MRLRLFSNLVDPVLSNGVEVWAVQLVVASAAGSPRGGLQQ